MKTINLQDLQLIYFFLGSCISCVICLSILVKYYRDRDKLIFQAETNLNDQSSSNAGK